MTVVWHVTMSLDGFIAGPDDSMEWAFATGGQSAIADDVRHGTGSILAGRRWYDVASAKYGGTGGIYGGAWTGPVFVLTRRPDDTPDDPTVTFLTEAVPDAVATARDAAGGKNIGIFGANLARQVVEAGLLDELVVHVAPVLLGDGVRLYGGPGADHVQLERTALAESGQTVDLRFRLAR